MAENSELFAQRGRAAIALYKHAVGWWAKFTHFSFNPTRERFFPQS